MMLPTASPAAVVGLWQFDADAAVQPDSSGFGNDATNVGATWVDDETRGGAMEFAAGHRLEVADSPSISIAGDITIAAWVNLANTDGFRSIVGKTTDNFPASYDLYVVSGTTDLRFYRGDGTNVNLGEVTSSGLTTNNWHHIAVTMEGQSVTHYLDGVESGTGTIAALLADNDDILMIGSRNDLVTQWIGRMDDVAIFDEALSAEEIGTIMGGDFSGFIIPEPSTALFALLGLSGLVLRRRR